MRKGRCGLALGLLAIITVASFGEGSTRSQDEPEVRAYKGRQLLQNDCFMCHTPEIISSQRLTSEQWKAEITKMIGWGAPVTAEEQPILLEFLTANYGPSVPMMRPARITIARADANFSVQPIPAIPAIPANPKGFTKENMERGGRLFGEQCASCHGRDARGGEGGTNLMEKPIMDRPTDFRDVVMKGRNRMPSFQTALNPDQESDIYGWMARLIPPR